MNFLLPLGFAVALSLLGDLSLFATLTTQLDNLGLTLAQAGVLLSVHRLVRLPSNPVAGALMDRFGRRPLFLLGATLAVISTASYGLVSGFWPLLLARAGWGMAWALINIGGLNMVLDQSTSLNRGSLSGAYNAWVWAGYALAPLLGGTLVDQLGFRPAMLIMAGVTSLGLLAAAWKLPETCPPAKRPARPRAVGQQVLALWSAARTLFGANPKARGVLVIYALVQFAGDGIVLSSITLLVTQRMGADIHVGGWVLGAASLGGALMAVRSVLALFSAPVAGRLSDGRLGRARLIALALGLGAVCFTVLALAQGLPALALGILLGALAGGGLAAGLPAYLGDCVGSEEQAVGLGAYATFGDAGSMLGPVVTLALAPLIGLTPVYLFAALIFVGGIVIIRPGRR